MKCKFLYLRHLILLFYHFIRKFKLCIRINVTYFHCSLFEIKICFFLPIYSSDIVEMYPSFTIKIK